MADEIDSLMSSNMVFEPLELDSNELVNFLRFMGDDRAKYLIEVYDSLSARERQNLDLDKLAEKAGISKQAMRSILISGIVEYDIGRAEYLLIVCREEVVKTVIQNALEDGPNSLECMKILMEYYGYWRRD